MPDTKTNRTQTDTERDRYQALDTRGSQERKGLSRWQSPGFAGGAFDFVERMAEEMDRTFDRVFGDYGFGRSSWMPRSLRQFGGSGESLWSPRVETFQKGDRFIVRAELPGLKKGDIHVDVTDDAITIQGERRVEHDEQREGYRQSELSYGQFFRRIPIPEGAIADDAKASFRDGVLEVTMPATPAEARARRLEISEATESKTK